MPPLPPQQVGWCGLLGSEEDECWEADEKSAGMALPIMQAGGTGFALL